MLNSDGVCIHHWVIDTPNGAFSDGVCKHCRMTRETFRNGFMDTTDEYNKPLGAYKKPKTRGVRVKNRAH